MTMILELDFKLDIERLAMVMHMQAALHLMRMGPSQEKVGHGIVSKSISQTCAWMCECICLCVYSLCVCV